MEIHCKLDYIIEVITAHQTLLAGAAFAGPPPPPQTAKSDNRAAAGGQPPPILSSGNQQPAPTARVCQSDGPTNRRHVSTTAARTTADNNYELHANLSGAAGSGGAAAAAAAAAATATDCDEQTRAKVAKEGQQRLFGLIRNECHLHNSCKLNLGTAGDSQAARNSTGSELPPPLQQANKLASFLAESCPTSRKLVEVAYRCRPTRVLRRNVCKNSQLNLECPSDKRLAIASAAYGFWPEDKRTHEKCAELAASGADQPAKLAAARQTFNKSCALASTTSALNVLSSECLFKQHCQLQVNQTLFGETNCSREQQPLEYLRLMYICMDDSALNYNATGFQQQLQKRQQMQSQLDAHFQGQPNVGSSSLVASSAPPATPATIQNDTPFGQKREAANQLVPPNTKVAAATTSGAEDAADEAEDAAAADGGERVLPIYPHSKGGAGADLAAASFAAQYEKLDKKVKLLLQRYQTQATLIALASLTVLMLALTVRVCKRNSARNSTASSSKGSSSSSSSAGAKSLSSYLTSSSSAGAQQSATGAAAQNRPQFGGAQRHQPPKLNSCSESCFSLEDYNGYFNESSAAAAAPPRETFNESPATAHQQQQQQQQGSLTPLGSQQHEQPPASAGYFSGGTARPKFWSFYGHEQNAVGGSLRLSAANSAGFGQQPPNYLQAAGGGGATTQRSFAGQQAHLQPPQKQLYQQHNHHHLPAARNFLLAPAAPPQLPTAQHEQQAQLCPAHSAAEQQQLEQHQFALLALNPAELQLAAAAAGGAQQQQQQQTCAFHQQQRQLLLAPAGAAFDLPPMAPPALNQPLQQQQQQDVIAPPPPH